MTLKPRTNSLAVRVALGDRTEHNVRNSPRARALRIMRRESAVEALGKLEPGLERYVITKGQFSLIDLVRAVLNQTGPADFLISTWTAHGQDISEAYDLMRDGRITSCRWLLDHTFLRRAPHFAGQVKELFGESAVRISRNHAKLCVFVNDTWAVTVLTSMNLNMNARMEYFLVREDRDLAEFNRAWVDDLFRKKPPGDAWSKRPADHERQFIDND